MRLFSVLSLSAIALFSNMALAKGIPPGNYVGTGTWFDADGSSGTVDVTYAHTLDSTGKKAVGSHEATFSDGRHYAGESNFYWKNDGIHYDIKKGIIKVGGGFCSPNHCVSKALWSLTEVTEEHSLFDGQGNLDRFGSIKGLGGGKRMYSVHMNKVN